MKDELEKLEWYNNEFAKPIMEIVSKMIEANRADGIFRTSECYEALNNLCIEAQASERQRIREIVEGMEQEEHLWANGGWIEGREYNQALEDILNELR